MKKKKIIMMVAIIILLCILGGGFLTQNFWLPKINSAVWNSPLARVLRLGKSGKIDDWKYEGDKNYYDGAGYNLGNSTTPMTVSEGFAGADSIASKSIVSDSSASKGTNFSSSDATLGYSVGGSKNVENFRENIKNGYFPISTDITYNGLYYDYYFDTGKSKKQDEMFYPTYSTAVSKDPISEKYEYYMTVGLNSNIKESDFQRKKLNLVVVMDISGSMSSSFNSYYYDRNLMENTLEYDRDENSKTKMQIANESLNLLIDELKEEDRLGIVLFDNESYLAKPVNLIGETDTEKIKEHILEIEARGGTNFEAGYTSGTGLFTEEMLNNSEYENRIIVITDAMPNLGNTSKTGLTKYVKENANKGIYTTFVGVGVDFNTEVIECLSDVKGANYYSVHSSTEFKKIMSEDFGYMVTPLVFDLELKLESNLFSIDNVYGTDTKDVSSGKIMKVNTLFPSSSNSSGETKGGIILLKLKPTEYDEIKLDESIEKETIELSVSYKDREGKEHSNSQTVEFKDAQRENYDNTGIRKAIVLARYVNLMKNWILYERTDNEREFYITDETGIEDVVYTPNDIYRILGENERTSTKLSVSKEYAELFTEFKEYMNNEIKAVGDYNMKQEIEILDLLCR